jgi:hypothetical protein
VAFPPGFIPNLDIWFFYTSNIFYFILILLPFSFDSSSTLLSSVWFLLFTCSSCEFWLWYIWGFVTWFFFPPYMIYFLIPFHIFLISMSFAFCGACQVGFSNTLFIYEGDHLLCFQADVPFHYSDIHSLGLFFKISLVFPFLCLWIRRAMCRLGICLASSCFCIPLLGVGLGLVFIDLLVELPS